MIAKTADSETLTASSAGMATATTRMATATSAGCASGVVIVKGNALIVAFVTDVVVVNSLANFSVAVEPTTHIAGMAFVVGALFGFVTLSIPIHAAVFGVTLFPIVLVAVFAGMMIVV